MSIISDMFDDLRAELSGNSGLWYARKYERDKNWSEASRYYKLVGLDGKAANCLYKECIENKNSKSIYLPEVIYLALSDGDNIFVQKVIIETVMTAISENSFNPFYLLTSIYRSNEREYSVVELLIKHNLFDSILNSIFQLNFKPKQLTNFLYQLADRNVKIPLQFAEKIETFNFLEDAAYIY